MAPPKRPKRKALTKRLERQVIVEARGQCPWCEKPVLAAEIEIHHIDGDRSNNSHENLILTCRNHHGQIGAQVIPLWEVIVKKQMLSNPQEMERLGFVPKSTSEPQPALVNGVNNGIAAQKVEIGTFNMPPRSFKGRREITPGLIEADPDMRTYANYLVKRYIDWRKKGEAIDGRPLKRGSAHGILAEGFGSPDSVLLIRQERFFAWVDQAKAKINRTTFGKINSSKGYPNFHSWEEHLEQRRKR